MERLLRATGVTAGLLCNGHALRLLSAPRGESSGWLDFKVADMAQTAGRPICAALRLLLGTAAAADAARASERLAALLGDSRDSRTRSQRSSPSRCCTRCTSCCAASRPRMRPRAARCCARVLADRPDDVYRALLTVILRLVFLLYAEEREMLPADDDVPPRLLLARRRCTSACARTPRSTPTRWTSATAPGRSCSPCSAWSTTARRRRRQLPARHGELFDPDRYPFLEGRPSAGGRQSHERIEPPLVPDGTVSRVLEKLLVLDGERLSYRALDVEQIGSVYETMMGFRLSQATGRSVAISAGRRRGAPTRRPRRELLAVEAGKRAKWVRTSAEPQATRRRSAPRSRTPRPSTRCTQRWRL